MKNIHNKKYINIVIPKILFIITIIIMIFFGFRQKETLSENKIQWLSGKKGLQFHNKSFAYTKKFFADESPDEAGLTIKLSVKPDFFEKPLFSFILQIYDKSDNSQIVIGQWEKSLVVLNSRDYSNKKREPKIYVPLVQSNRIQTVIVTSDNSGTDVYINGELKGRNPDLHLLLPEQSEKTNLIVGNGIGGQNPWIGSLFGLAIYDRALDVQVSEINQFKHTENKGSVFSDADRPQLLYTFDNSGGSLVHDNSNNKNDLILPEKIIILKKKILKIPDITTLDTPAMKIDLLLNYFGFMPFGILLFFTVYNSGLKRKQLILLLTAIISFIFSISIELAQIYLPARNSSLVDLFLNTLGGLSGGLIARKYFSS